MIALLEGEVAVRRADHVVVSADGVGYRLARLRRDAAARAASRRATTSLHTHLIVRDDALLLYGFATEEERDLFLLLIGVQAVGPKMALAVLSGGPPRELLGAVAAGDTARLQAVPGIGKRTAERIVVELREKVGATTTDDPIVITRGDDPRDARPRRPARPRLQPAGGRQAARRRARRHARGPDRARAARVRADDPHPRRRPHPGPAAAARGGPATPRCAPRCLDEFVGQDAVKEQLAVAIQAAKASDEPLDHVLLAGPPGLGKTSLAQIVAAELDVPFIQTAGPALERKADIAAFLTGLEPRAVFFVDEIHRLAARGRGDLLSRDGGPAAADHGRRPAPERASSRSTCRRSR